MKYLWSAVCLFLSMLYNPFVPFNQITSSDHGSVNLSTQIKAKGNLSPKTCHVTFFLPYSLCFVELFFSFFRFLNVF